MTRLLLIIVVWLIGHIGYAAPQTQDWWTAKDYVKHAGLQYKWGIQYIRALPFKPSDTVLDIGAGDGRLTAFIARKVPKGQVIGIEPSQSMIQQAQNSFPTLTFPNLRFEQKTVESMRFKNQFDWIVSFSTLHWVKDMDQAFTNMAQALKPKGHLFLYFAPDYGRNRIDQALDEIMAQPAWQPYFKDFTSSFHLITPTQLLSLIDKHDLLLEHLKIITVEEAFPSKAAFKQWMQVSLPQVRYLPKERQNSFMEAIITRYLEKRPALYSKGTLTYFDYWLEVAAQKNT